MPRYFFHVHEAAGVTEDPEGAECQDEAAARKEAIEAARDIMAEHVRKGLDVSGWSFEIVDERGRPALIVPFAEAVQRIAL